MRVGCFVATVSLVLGCGSAASPSFRAEAPSVAPLATLAPRWERPVDGQAGAVVLGDRLVVSEGDAIVFHALDDGRETARAPGSDAFRASIDAPSEPALLPLDSFVIAVGRGGELARFDRDAVAPRWTSTECTRAWAVVRLGVHVAAVCSNGLVVLDAQDGRVIATVSLPEADELDEHAAVAVDDGIVVRVGDTLVRVGDDATTRFGVSVGGTFGLARRGTDSVVVGIDEGLLTIAPGGSREGVIRIPGLRLVPDATTGRLGRVTTDGDLAIVEAGGVAHALSLETERVLWTTRGRDALAAGDAVYLCAGVRAVALERAGGDERWSWSVGGCEILGASGDGVVVRRESVGPAVTARDLAHEAVTSFARGEREVPCEQAVVHGVVRVNGAPAAGVHVRAGVAWSSTASGAIAGWGVRVLPDPDARPPTSVGETDAAGGYALRFCDRGHVPVVVDHADVERLAGEPEVEANAAYVHLAGGGDYVLDLDVSTHGPTL